MAYTLEHIVVPENSVIVLANKKWIEPGKFLWRQPTLNKVRAMIKQLEKMTLTEKISATTLLAWRWPSAWKMVRETMRAQELKVKKEARQAAEKAVLKAKAVARGNAKVRAKAKRIAALMAVLKPKKGNTKVVARTLQKLKETLKRMCRPAPVVMAVSMPDPLPPRVSAVPGAHKVKVCINKVLLRGARVAIGPKKAPTSGIGTVNSAGFASQKRSTSEIEMTRSGSSRRATEAGRK
jgi:hypothetical protein